MKVSAIAFAFFVQQVAANKKSKAGSASGSVTSCPNFSSSSKRSGASKQSKAGFAAGTADCGSGSTETVRCGDSFLNEKVYLLKDLVCDGEDDTITLRGEHAVLDCGGRTIIGRDDSYEDQEDVILELRDGASVINCNFVRGYHAIETFGDNVCTTIENVSVEDTRGDGIRTQHSGTVVIRDVTVSESYYDGIDMHIDDGNSLHAILENVRSLNNGEEGSTSGLDFGAAFDCDESCGDIVVDLYGNIFLWDNYNDNLDATSDYVDIDITVFGNLFAGDSDYYDGVDLSDGNTITFAAGSFSELCGNDYDDDDDNNDLEYDGGRVFVEEGAVVICDLEDPDNDKCTDSCDVEEALACVE